MWFKSNHVGWFHLILHALPNIVLVEKSCSSSKCIWGGFKVICLQVVDDSWSHVCVVFSWSYTWEQRWAKPSLDLLSEIPDRSDEETEVDEDQGPTVLATFNLDGVQVHVVLWSIAMIKSSIDVLQVNESCVHILRSQLWIWLVEMATSSPDCCYLGDTHHLSCPHRSWKHVHVRVHIY